MFTGIAET